MRRGGTSRDEHIGPVLTLYRSTWPYIADNVDYSRVPHRVFTLRSTWLSGQATSVKQHLSKCSKHHTRTLLVLCLDLPWTQLSLGGGRVEFFFSRPLVDRAILRYIVPNLSTPRIPTTIPRGSLHHTASAGADDHAACISMNYAMNWA